MKNDKDLFKVFEDLEKNSVLIHKDRDGTEYYAPRVLYPRARYNPRQDEERKAKVKFAKDYHRRDMAKLWRQIWFDLGMILDDIRWYLEILITG